VTVDGFWIDDRMDTFNIQLVATFYKSLSHKDCSFQSRSSLLCLVASSNSGCSSAPGSCPRRLAAISHQPPTLLTLVIKGTVRVKVTTDGQSASLSWCQTPNWGPRAEFYYCQTVAGLLMWGPLSDERTDLLLTIAAGSRQCSHSRV
jgi:hypothetical protein